MGGSYCFFTEKSKRCQVLLRTAKNILSADPRSLPITQRLRVRLPHNIQQHAFQARVASECVPRKVSR